MQNANFIQSHELLELNTLKCLRNEYFFNDCTLCFEQCPENALGLHKEKIKLFEDKCTLCAECIGICPTESLSVENFDVNEFVLSLLNKDTHEIIEKQDIPSLSMLDTPHLISLVLRKRQNILLKYSENISENSLAYIQERVRHTNAFLTQISWESSVFLQEIKTDTSRRSLFKTLFKSNQTIQSQSNATKQLFEKEKLSAKMTLLKNSIKMTCEDFGTAHISAENSSVFFNKEISYDACTNCVECITFCPTDALFQNSQKDEIYFSSGKCIGCNICQEVCKTQAITSNEHIDLIEFAFSKASKKVHFEYATCEECNAPFVFKNAETRCHRCVDFKENFSSMFKMAKDL